jgi:hypothetical protein
LKDAREMAMLRNMPALGGVLGTAALASLIAGLLLSYQWDPADPRLVKVPPASPEMMQLLQDEHRLIANMVELQIAREKKLAYGEASN